MSRAVDFSALLAAISIAGASVSAVIYFKDDQARQDASHADGIAVQADLAAAREEQAQAEIDTRAWRISGLKQMQREGTCDEACIARLEGLEEDARALQRKRDALVKEQQILRAKK